MEFSPLKKELVNNYAVTPRLQPLLARARRYSGACGENATDGRHKTVTATKTRPRGRVLLSS
jgi:hypothetical protein